MSSSSSPDEAVAKNVSRALYKSLSSVLKDSFYDDGQIGPGGIASSSSTSDDDSGIKGSVRSIGHSNMNIVIPSKGLSASFRAGTSSSRPTSFRGSIRGIPYGGGGNKKYGGVAVTKDEGEELFQDRHLISFAVIYTMIFFNGCCFTAVVPSVPFYLQVLGAASSFLGWVVSFYSLGQIIGSPLAGMMSERLSKKNLLTISSSVGLLSSILYATAPGFWFILVSRLLTGISAGFEFTTELTYIAQNTTQKERTTFLASVTACNVVGFIMGPALGTLLASLDFHVMGLAINQYTGPGWLLAAMFVIDLFMVRGLFREHDTRRTDDANDADNEKTGLVERSKVGATKVACYGVVSSLDEKKKDTKTTLSAAESRDEPLPFSMTMVISMIFVQFTVMCAWSVLETITSPLAQDEFDWGVQECNLLFTAGGFISLIAYFAFVVASKWVQDRWLIVYALLLCSIGLMLAIDWSQLGWVPNSLSQNLPSYMTRFVTGYMIMNAGFMTGRPVTFALYSKLIPSQYQGKFLGWMVAGGSAARTLGPFGAVYLYYGITSEGINLLALFGSEALFQLACLVLVICLWSELLPKSSHGSKPDKGYNGDERAGWKGDDDGRTTQNSSQNSTS